MPKTVINGFTVTIDSDNCWIEKGHRCSSLALVESLGHIEDINAAGTDAEPVPEETIDKIRIWADIHGF